MIVVKVIRNKSANDFLELNESILRKNITANNFLLGQAVQSIKGISDYADIVFFTVFIDDQVIGQALNTDKEHNLLVTKMPDFVAPYIIDEFIKHRGACQGVGGDIETAMAAVEVLGERWKKQYRLHDRLGVYELNDLMMPDSRGCSLISQDEVNPNLALEWVAAFIKECDMTPNLDYVVEAKKVLKRHQKIKGLRFLKNSDGKIVSMAAKHREFEDRATVSFVYTPPKFRRNGYGKIVTALLTDELLRGEYVQCNLFTDLLNPTSNKIYQEIGYEFVGENVSYLFY